MHDCNEQKGAIRRFNTIYNQLNQFDDNTQKFLKNLNKKNSTKQSNTTKILIFPEPTTK